jgi:hypothetical protein
MPGSGWNSIWRPLCGLAVGGTAIALQLGTNDLSHPEWHAGVALGTLQFAHTCYVAALVLTVIAGCAILGLRNVTGTTMAWFAIAVAGGIFLVGGFDLRDGDNAFTVAGAGTAMLLCLASWSMVAVLLVVDVRRSTRFQTTY